MRDPLQALPKPPEIPRHLVFNRLKAVGLPILLSIPLLALFGVFGTRTGEVTAEAPGLELRLRYPERLRYKISDRLEISVKNTGARTLYRVTVRIDQAYAGAFSEVHFIPEARRISEGAYEIDLDGVVPGETRQVHVTLQANDYGRQRGTIAIVVGGATQSTLTVSTLTFP